MKPVKIHHKTTYRYREKVTLGPHRLMLRPRESRDIHLIATRIACAPEASLSWAYDIAGNAVATAHFAEATDLLVIDSVAELHMQDSEAPQYDIAPAAATYPFKYADDERIDLGALAVQQYPDPDGRLKAWTQGFVMKGPTGTLALLKDLSEGAGNFEYRRRESEGTQAPLETLELKSGSCRDLAVLFSEAARSLGFGARIVSGYLYNADPQTAGPADSTATHAWAEIYLPGAGWITFDPTNHRIGGANLIPVAVARGITQAMPVTGSFTGSTAAFEGMTVEVSVTV